MVVRCSRGVCSGSLFDEPEIDGMIARCCTLCGDRAYRVRDEAIDRAMTALVRASFMSEERVRGRGRPRRYDEAGLNLAVALLDEQRERNRTSGLLVGMA